MLLCQAAPVYTFLNICENMNIHDGEKKKKYFFNGRRWCVKQHWWKSEKIFLMGVVGVPSNADIYIYI